MKKKKEKKLKGGKKKKERKEGGKKLKEWMGAHAKGRKYTKAYKT